MDRNEIIEFILKNQGLSGWAADFDEQIDETILINSVLDNVLHPDELEALEITGLSEDTVNYLLPILIECLEEYKNLKAGNPLSTYHSDGVFCFKKLRKELE